MKRLEVISKKVSQKFLRLTKTQQLEYLLNFINYFLKIIPHKDEKINTYIHSLKHENNKHLNYKAYFQKKSEEYDENYFSSQEKNEPIEKWMLFFLKARLYSSLTFIIDNAFDEALYELSVAFENNDAFIVYFENIII